MYCVRYYIYIYIYIYTVYYIVNDLYIRYTTWTYINAYIVSNTASYLFKTMAGKNGDCLNLFLPDIPLHVLELIILSDNYVEDLWVWVNEKLLSE